MRSQFDTLKLARICLQLESPLSIASGQTDIHGQALLVSDANHLPLLPGTSIAGVLRQSLRRAGMDEEGVLRLFGAARDHSQEKGGLGALELSFGHIHNAHNQPCDGRQPLTSLQADPILAPLLESYLPQRDQVRIDQRGMVDGRGKFQRSIVPRGHRFTLQLGLWFSAENAEQAAADWQALQQAFADPLLRLGGASRSGLGRLRLLRWQESEFAMRDTESAARYANLPVDLAQALPTAEDGTGWRDCTVAYSNAQTTYCLQLEFADYWRCGQGEQDLQEGWAGVLSGNLAADTSSPNAKQADLLPLQQQVVCWPDDANPSQPQLAKVSQAAQSDQRASLQSLLYLPGSSIKGVLRHRSAYYLRCLQGEFADTGNTAKEMGQAGEASEADKPSFDGLSELFGALNDVNGKQQAHAGKLLVEDAYLPLPSKPPAQGAQAETNQAVQAQTMQAQAVQTLWHSSIDHFTQGVRRGALFGEQMLYGGSWECCVRLLCKPQQLPKEQRIALQMAMQDLAQGRLALGAASARGHGYAKQIAGEK